MDKDINRQLLDLNLDYINIVNSKEYLLGNRILSVKKMIDDKQYFRLILRLIQVIKRKRTEKAMIPFDSFFDYGLKNKCALKGTVYSCVVGHYDSICRPPLALNHKVDYNLFSDDKELCNQWTYNSLPNLTSLDTTMINRYIKLHPFLLFENRYDYCIYIDGNVEIIGDVEYLYSIAQKAKTGIAMHLHPRRKCVYEEGKTCARLKKGNPQAIINQIKKYQEEGFPTDWGLFEATIIVVDLHNINAKRIFDAWWHELNSSDSKRDQLSFPYVLWKLGYDNSDVGILGANKSLNPYFRIHAHR